MVIKLPVLCRRRMAQHLNGSPPGNSLCASCDWRVTRGILIDGNRVGNRVEGWTVTNQLTRWWTALPGDEERALNLCVTILVLPFGVDKNCSFDCWSSIGLTIRCDKGDARINRNGSSSLAPSSSGLFNLAGLYTNRLFPLKHLFTSIVLPLVCLSFFPLKAKAQEEMYWGTIVRNPPANYVVRMDDGKILNAEWESGYDQWSIGERIILTTENGSGIMFFNNTRTQVAVFRYNPSEIGD
jgi:hypothetical protein